MSYKLNANLVPFLHKGTDGKLTARLTGGGSGSAVIELQDGGLTLKVRTKDLGFELGKSLGASLEFDAAGVLLSHTLDTPPKTTPTATRASSGSTRPRSTSQF